MTPTAKTASPTASYSIPLSSAPLQLVYSVDPSTVFFSTTPEMPSIVTFTVLIVNASLAAVQCDRITLAFPVGQAMDALTPSGTGIAVTSHQSSWVASALADGVIELRPSLPDGGRVAPEQKLQFSARVTVNRAQGLTYIGVTEERADQERAGRIPISKIAPARTLTFTAPEFVAAGQKFALSWDAPLSSHCTITRTLLPNGPKLPEDDSFKEKADATGSRDRVALTQSTLFTITAYGKGPELTLQRVVVVPQPTITKLESSSGIVEQGNAVTLAWDTANADGVFIDPGPEKQPLAAKGTYTTPLLFLTQAFQVTPVNGGARGAPVTITVNVPVARIENFEQVPDPRAPATKARLTWTAVRATSCSISPDPKVPVGRSGRIDVEVAADTPYTLTATGQNGPTRRTIVVRKPGFYRAASLPVPLSTPYQPGEWPILYSNTSRGLVIQKNDYADNRQVCRTFETRDLKSWTEVPDKTTVIPGSGVGVWHDERFWRVGSDNNQEPQVWWSSDAITWLQVRAVGSWSNNSGQWWDARRPGSLISYNGLMYLVSQRGRYSNGEMWSSPNGRVWTRRGYQAVYPSGSEAVAVGAMAGQGGSLWGAFGGRSPNAPFGAFCSRFVLDEQGFPFDSLFTVQWGGAPLLEAVGNCLYMIPPAPARGIQVQRMDPRGNWQECATWPEGQGDQFALSGQLDGRIVLIAGNGEVWYYVPE